MLRLGQHFQKNRRDTVAVLFKFVPLKHSMKEPSFSPNVSAVSVACSASRRGSILLLLYRRFNEALASSVRPRERSQVGDLRESVRWNGRIYFSARTHSGMKNASKGNDPTTH